MNTKSVTRGVVSLVAAIFIAGTNAHAQNNEQHVTVTYIFTYQITDRGTGIILATGKVTAFDGNIAAPRLAGRIVEDIKKARGELKDKK